MPEVSLVVFAVSQFLGRCCKGTICRCVLVGVLVGIAIQPRSEGYVWVSLKDLSSLVF